MLSAAQRGSTVVTRTVHIRNKQELKNMPKIWILMNLVHSSLMNVISCKVVFNL